MSIKKTPPNQFMMEGVKEFLYDLIPGRSSGFGFSMKV
jgi:hypothetical protein